MEMFHRNKKLTKLHKLVVLLGNKKRKRQYPNNISIKPKYLSQMPWWKVSRTNKAAQSIQTFLGP